MRACLGLALIAGACGGGDDDVAETVDTVNQDIKDEVDNALGSSTTTTAAAGETTTTAAPVAAKPTSIEDWEKLWAKERAAVVKKIKDNKWGVQADGKTVARPRRFQDGPGRLPGQVGPTPRASPTPRSRSPAIRPFSGTLADAGNINVGAGILFDYYASKGLFTDSAGRTARSTWSPATTVTTPPGRFPLVDEFIESEKAAAHLGSGLTVGARRPTTRSTPNCVAHLFAVTGHPAWGDPVNHPWTTGILFAYNTEAVLWGSFIDNHAGLS